MTGYVVAILKITMTGYVVAILKITNLPLFSNLPFKIVSIELSSVSSK